MLQDIKDEAGQEIIYFSQQNDPTAPPLLLGTPQETTSHYCLFFLPTRTPVPNLISKCFEGNLFACKLTEVVPPGVMLVQVLSMKDVKVSPEKQILL